MDLTYIDQYISLDECAQRVTGKRLLVAVMPPPPNEHGIIAPPNADRNYPITARVDGVGPDCEEVKLGDMIVLGGASVLFIDSSDGQRGIIDEGSVISVATGPVHDVPDEAVRAASIILPSS